jgi:hypothetical protein
MTPISLIEKAIYLHKNDIKGELLLDTLLLLEKEIKKEDSKTDTVKLFEKLSGESDELITPNEVINKLRKITTSNIIEKDKSKGIF